MRASVLVSGWPEGFAVMVTPELGDLGAREAHRLDVVAVRTRMGDVL